MFEPPRCPRSSCPAHLRPEDFGHFYKRVGYYWPKCRPSPVPRFWCRVCKRGFSRQTFRADCYDKKPQLNVELFRLLSSGLGLRHSARLLDLSRRCCELKARKISYHLRRLNRNLTGQFGEDAEFSFDEMESFEGCRSVLPVTLPFLVEKDSRFVVATEVASIRPSGKMSEARKRAVEKQEKRRGKRWNGSRRAIRMTFLRLATYTKNLQRLSIVTDKKQLYGTLLREVFEPRGIEISHQQVSSKRKRDASNPLQASNWAQAMARDMNGRLRRESWLASKRRRFLRLQLHLYCAYRNFVRRRINSDPRSAAQVLGFVERRLDYGELLTWRQDWRERSIHTLAGTAVPEALCAVS